MTHACQQHLCTCFIIPTKILLHFQDQKSALLSERLRGNRDVSAQAFFGGITTGAKRRTIYDAGHTSTLPGSLVRGEDGQPSADATVNAAFDGSGITYDFYQQVLQRNSIDGKGLRLDSTVHFGDLFNNAFWNGSQMVYGDGDGTTFVGFVQALDVVAHELTHGVTQNSVPGGLVYKDQSGALNESISDVFGSVVKQWHKQQDVSQADWLIGDGIMGAESGKALRSMQDPGNRDLTWVGDDQPKTMDGYEEGGDVHTNSGIPNYAFYLAAMNLGGNSWDKAAKIWYQALPLLHPNASFKEAAKATVHAVNLLGYKKVDRDAVTAAWRAVKVLK
ncbi:M4 family metallopeptidase [Methylovulum psychrotolerans]|uniref:Neutral metalloproteinase n=1 Tax=Methylovulum psychrotolerans TaxID=1704499 RepID=A0A1Z4C4C1_9GAMM|nr:M4 family metallopeptidase [Methylovulum psychrotolerans]ASF48391.1 peptidase M4 family protein [Methylovulum psychrotolerans]